MRSWTFGALLALLTQPVAAATLVVGNKGEDSVSLIDLDSGQERLRLATGPQPHEVAISPDGKRAAVVAYGGHTIDIVDIAAGRRAATLDLSPNQRPHGIVWLQDGRILATTEGSDSLTLVDAVTGKVRTIPTGQKGSHMVAVSPDGRRAFVANMKSATVGVIDLADGRKRADLRAGEEPEGLALTPDGRELWVADRRGNQVLIFDATRLRPLARIAVGRMPIRIAISRDGATAITSNYLGGDLTIIDRATRRVARTVAVSGSAEAGQVTIAFAPDGRRLFVAETAPGRIAEVDLETGKVLRRLAAGKGSDGLAVATANVAASKSRP